ncbi:hypothetical protein PIB30_101258 [Stylosanthes scabra]|uniref:Collagen-like protein n=1 Tax=Stylosanthes scabra TaxID=79078 RepID=A0ABU6YYU5_9FABA|nr:hypothetical protein [Stylosanthes scabra]
MSEEQQTEGTRVYDRLVGVDGEGRLPPVVATQLKGDPGAPGEPGEPGKPGSPGPAGVSVESVERAGDDTEAKAVFRLSDESTHEVALPRGPQGAKGDPGATVNIRDNNDGTVTIEGGAAA